VDALELRVDLLKRQDEWSVLQQVPTLDTTIPSLVILHLLQVKLAVSLQPTLDKQMMKRSPTDPPPALSPRSPPVCRWAC
jgi:hypothetical protein